MFEKNVDEFFESFYGEDYYFHNLPEDELKFQISIMKIIMEKKKMGKNIISIEQKYAF
jgi:hypothetical protein